MADVFHHPVNDCPGRQVSRTELIAEKNAGYRQKANPLLFSRPFFFFFF